MAIRALPERDRLLEVTTRVTLLAAQQRVFAQQGVFRGRVIELARQYGRRHRLPGYGAVARLAGIDKGAAVRVGVAAGAAIEDQPGPARGSASLRRCMALFAEYARVRPGKSVARTRVIELRDVLPVVGGVAASS